MTRSVGWAAAALAVAALSSCGGTATHDSSPRRGSSAPNFAPPGAAQPAPVAHATPRHLLAPRFSYSVAEIGTAFRRAMTSWKPGCPVPVSDLRIAALTYWGFDNKVHIGQLS